jgi:spore maturation protein CgeB
VLNILVIGKFYTEGFALHIAETLAVMGHAVRRFEPGLQAGRLGGKLGHRIDQARGVLYNNSDGIPAVRARRMRALWQESDAGPLDVVIVCHDFLWPNEVAELKRRTGAQIAMWFPDHLANFGRGYFMNARYDGLFFKDPYIKHVLGDVLQSPVYFLPECFNPAMHWLPEERIGQDPQYQCDITTAGNQHSWRVACYKHLTGYNVKLWGNPAPLWMDAAVIAKMHQGRGVYNHDKVRAFRGASIVVNNLHYGEMWGLNVRAFEAAGAGAFQMVDWRPGLGQLFNDGKELISFISVADLKQKVDYWLPRKDERRQIAAAGMRRAHAQHTYALRLQLLLDTLGGRATGFPIPRFEYGVANVA